MQLYTVREVMKDDFEGKLAKVAEIGYREVEFAGYENHTPQEIRAMLDRHGLTGPSAHVPYKSLGDAWPGVLDAAHVVGHQYLVNPYIDDDVRKGPDGWKRAAETFNRAGEASQKAGIQFAYHNHWFEFAPVNGKLPYDILLEECDPKLVKMEMDLCWIEVGGQDPLKYFKKYPGRFPLVHVKDLTKIPKVDASGGQNFGDSLPEMTEVGSGIHRLEAHLQAIGQSRDQALFRGARPSQGSVCKYQDELRVSGEGAVLGKSGPCAPGVAGCV